MTDPTPNPNSAAALFAPPAFRHVKPTAEDMKPPAPRHERPIFPDGPKGPWRWPALEDARSRHLAAIEALSAAREVEDVDAERKALLDICDAVIEGCGAVRATHASAEAAYKTAVKRVQATIPVDGSGVIPGHERDRARAIKRSASEWARPDLESIRRCWGMTEQDEFKPDGSGATVARLVADVERVRAGLVGGHAEAEQIAPAEVDEEALEAMAPSAEGTAAADEVEAEDAA